MEKRLAIVAYLLSRLKLATRGKIAKLLFLLDAASWKHMGHYVTTFKYRKYYLGPYPPDLVEIEFKLYAHRLAIAVTESVAGKSGERKVLHDLWIGPEPFDVLARKERKLTDDVVKQFGALTTNELVELIQTCPKYETLPYGSIIEPYICADLIG